VAFDTLRQEQAAWLQEVIRTPEMQKARYRVVFCHIPLRWIDESAQDYAKGGFDRYSRRSRDAWHGALTCWKAQVIVSGHTHRTAWIPADRSHPYGQLVGGGPQPASATWLEGNADADALTLTLRKLDGTVVHEVQVRPVGG
jgi:UDP-2,3-diacylglucosamine pyrophosphatase LpxH